MNIKLLESGYWHVRFNMNQFIQWPKDRPPERADCFGEISDQQIAEAATAIHEIP